MSIDIEDKAIRISEVMMQTLYNACHWELEDIDDDGDEYNAIHSDLMHLVIKELANKIR